MQWTAIKQRSQQLNQLSYCTLFLGLRSETVLYFTFLTSTARLCAYRSVCQLIFLISFRHFDTFGAYPSAFFFSVARWNTLWHCEFVAGTLHPCAESSAVFLKSGVSCQFNQQWEKSICKSHWVHWKMNDFNNNNTFSNWKVTEWMRLTRLGGG